jgi:hypothetical protein
MAGMMRHTNYKEVLIVKRSKNFKALARALGVVSAVVVVVSGVTFAALQSQQNVLAGNTIETATPIGRRTPAFRPACWPAALPR